MKPYLKTKHIWEARGRKLQELEGSLQYTTSFGLISRSCPPPEGKDIYNIIQSRKCWCIT